MRATRPTSFAALLIVLSVAAHGQDTNSKTLPDHSNSRSRLPTRAPKTPKAPVTEAPNLSPEDALLTEFAYFKT